MYKYTNCIGTFYFDKDIKPIKGRDGSVPDARARRKIRQYFKDKRFFSDFHKKNLEISKKRLKKAWTDDHLIIQAVACISELDKTINLLVKRIREWHDIYHPELSKETQDNEKFVRKLLSAKRSESFGADLEKIDLDAVNNLIKHAYDLYKLKKETTDYIETKMETHCPNLLDLAGGTIGARLLTLAGSLKKLATSPSTVVQLLGAEKALFKHLTRNTKSPKYGVIVNHQIIQKSKNKGKASRALAAKLSICSKLDYFKGERKGKQYLKELEAKEW